MGIRTDDDISWIGKLLSHNLVTDTAAGFKKVTAGFSSELAQEDVVIRLLAVRTRGSMINKDSACPGVDRFLEPALLELAQGERAGCVLDKGKINFGDDDIASSGISTRPDAKYFLSERFSHSSQLVESFFTRLSYPAR